MFVDGRHSHLKEDGEQGLGKPKRLILKTALDPGPRILGLVEQDFAVRR